MIGLDPAGKNRLRLWLRSERAFGLTRLPSPAAFQAVPIGPMIGPGRPLILARPVIQSPRVAPPLPLIKAEQNSTVARRDNKPMQPPLLILPGSAAPFSAPLLSRVEKIARLAALDAEEVKGCTKCRLSETRTNTVFGEGDPDAAIFFVGEGPGETEDQTGRPFVGRSGQLLDKMIGSMGLTREQVFIANIVKCRPPQNRVPGADEVATCTPYLLRQLEIVRPRVIVTLGLPATSYMLRLKLPMGQMRGQWHSWRGIKLMPTFHPSYVLRKYTEEVRAAVWSDLKQVLLELGMSVPKRAGG